MRLPVGVCAWGACLHACMNAGLGITSQNTDRGTFRSRKENEPFLSMISLPKACYTGLMVTDRILQSDMYLVHGHDRRSHERMVSSYAKSDRLYKYSSLQEGPEYYCQYCRRRFHYQRTSTSIQMVQYKIELGSFLKSTCR